MENKEIILTKSLRFRLTIIYSIILFIFSSLFVLGINIYLDNYLSSEPPTNVRRIGWVVREGVPMMEITQDQRDLIREIRRRDLEEIQDFSVIALIPLSLLSFALGYYISGRFLYPLKLLQNEVDNLKEKNLGAQVKIHSKDEIGLLANSFNDLSSRLKLSFDAQTQFVQDASHELRTPLTIMQTNLDIADSDESLSKEELREAISNALDGTKRITKLTGTLLDLTVANKLKLVETDIRDIVNEQISLLEDFAKVHKVKLTNYSPVDPIRRRVDKVLLGRAIFNLIENAVKYSQEVKKPEVKIITEVIDKKCIIKVIDNGKGIPAALQAKIFERFYRVDKSRSRQSGGFGLGLSIVKKIIDDHGGNIEVKSDNTGTEFKIVLT